jgi:hypothetical protein
VSLATPPKSRGARLLTLPKCGAKNRQGLPCRCPAMRNGRCRLHGGLSTGPRTTEGLERLRAARTVHGFYTQAAVNARRQARARFRLLEQLLGALR